MAMIDTAYHITRSTADLYVEQVGPEDGQPILFLHGGPGYNSYSFRELVGDDLEQYRMIYTDQRGGGRTYTDEGFTLQDIARDLAAIVRALELPSVTLLAHGFGAIPAVLAAREHPELFTRLVFVGPWFSMPLLARTIQRTAARLSEREYLALPPEEELGAEANQDPARLVEDAFSWISAKEVFDALEFPSPSSRLRLEHSDSEALSGPIDPPTLADPWTPDVLADLEQLDVPVIIMAGQQDRSAVPEQVEAALQRLPDALFSLTEGGHYPWLDDPDNFLGVLGQAMAAK